MPIRQRTKAARHRYKILFIIQLEFLSEFLLSCENIKEDECGWISRELS